MFTDIVEYTKRMQEDEKTTLKMLEEHNQIIFPIIASYNGTIIKLLGDGVLADFISAVQAVKCAIEIQRALTKYNKGKDDHERIVIRIGIHLGDVVYKRNDVFGDGVNYASRIYPLAEPGGVCISQTVYDVIKSATTIQTVNLGPVELKHVKGVTRIYKVLMEAQEASSDVRPSVKKRTSFDEDFSSEIHLRTKVCPSCFDEVLFDSWMCWHCGHKFDEGKDIELVQQRFFQSIKYFIRIGKVIRIWGIILAVSFLFYISVILAVSAREGIKDSPYHVFLIFFGLLFLLSSFMAWYGCLLLQKGQDGYQKTSELFKRGPKIIGLFYTGFGGVLFIHCMFFFYSFFVGKPPNTWMASTWIVILLSSIFFIYTGIFVWLKAYKFRTGLARVNKEIGKLVRTGQIT